MKVNIKSQKPWTFPMVTTSRVWSGSTEGEIELEWDFPPLGIVKVRCRSSSLNWKFKLPLIVSMVLHYTAALTPNEGLSSGGSTLTCIRTGCKTVSTDSDGDIFPFIFAHFVSEQGKKKNRNRSASDDDAMSSTRSKRSNIVMGGDEGTVAGKCTAIQHIVRAQTIRRIV